MCQSTSNQLSFFNVCQPLSLRQIQWREPFESWKTPRDNFLKPCRLLAKILPLMGWCLGCCICANLISCVRAVALDSTEWWYWFSRSCGVWLHHLPWLTQTPLSHNSRHTHPHPSWPSAVRFFEEDVEQTAQITRAKCHLWLVPLAQGINRSCGWKVRTCLRLQALVI